MSVTLPSIEFTGLLNDVIPFALDEPDLPNLNCVRIAWDGEQLHMQATDNLHVAWSRWHPDDLPDADAQESLLEPVGSDDSPWERVITLADAQALAKGYKVDKKRWFTPVHLDGSSLETFKVIRNRVPGLPAITTTVDHQIIAFPDLAATFAEHDRADAVRGVAFTANLLAHFATVRPRGPMELTFTGRDKPVVVAIGERFNGLIQPVRPAERHLRAAA